MKIDKDKHKYLIDWIKESEDTNNFVNRSLITDAIINLEGDNPDINQALGRLYAVAPTSSADNYVLISPPDFAIEIEMGNL